MAEARSEGSEGIVHSPQENSDEHESVEKDVLEIFAEAQGKRGRMQPTTLDDIEKRREPNEALGRPVQ
jgi:hypothetical protein